MPIFQRGSPNFLLAAVPVETGAAWGLVSAGADCLLKPLREQPLASFRVLEKHRICFFWIVSVKTKVGNFCGIKSVG